LSVADSACCHAQVSSEAPLRFHWSMSSAGVRLKGASARADQSGIPDLAATLEYGRHAERCGIESLLTAVGFHRPDPLILATAIGVQTASIRFMIALRSGIASPTLVVQQINSLSAILGGRIHLNIVAGHTPAEQRGYGDFLEHDDRYARTDEFLQVCRALWEQGGPVDFAGTHYRIEGAKLNTPWVSDEQPRPRIYVGGKSSVALALAARHADCLWTLPERPDELRERVAGLRESGTGVGLLASIIARPTRGQALDAAASLLAEVSGTARRTHREFSARSDSVAFTSTLASAEDPEREWLTPTLWTGLVPYLGAPAVAFVGSYDEVAAALIEWRDAAGISEYLFMGWPDLEEMTRFADEVRPRVRAREQQRQAHVSQ
jgi:alkanesulfonate monooxygenase